MAQSILHVNTDDFYASVLRLQDPTLREKPLVVAGPLPRGVVFSASYEARGDGVCRGMTVSTARRLCPRAWFLPPGWKLFRGASRAMNGILKRYSPAVELVSLDECYLDYTGCSRLFGSALDAGAEIKEEILEGTGLQVSIGLATNKLVSHVASRRAKCAHLVDVYPGYERSFLASLPVHRFPPVGRKRAPLLRELGIRRVEDILSFDPDLLRFCFGSWGVRLYYGARGEDTSPVKEGREEESRYAVEETLQPDRVERGSMEAVLYRLSERMGEKLRRERSLTGSLVLELVYSDGMMVRGREKPFPLSSDDLVIFEAAERAFRRIYKRRVRVRSLCLTAGGIEPEPVQMKLFGGEEGRGKIRKLREALDHLRGSFPAGVAPAFGRSLPRWRRSRA